MSRDFKITLAAFMALVLVFGLGELFTPASDNEQSIECSVAPGMSFREATDVLAQKGLVRNTFIFRVMGRLTGVHRKLIPGEYTFPGTSSTWDVFEALRLGKVRLLEFTVVEGDNLDIVRLKLDSAGIMNSSEFDRLRSDPAFMAGLGINAPSLEGYLFPDTYRFARGLEPERVLRTMVRRMKAALTEERIGRAAGRGMDVHGMLTLASIIEEEAKVSEERPLISAVYHNRLRTGMKLQSDPTAIYGIKQMSEGVRASDIRRRTPYNTYFINSLPPGPISSPGLASIEAAISPAEVPYLFFVSNANGAHVFTSTLEEHEKAIKEFRRARARMKREAKYGIKQP